MRALVFPALLLLLAPFLAPGAAGAQPAGAQPLDRLLPQIRRDHPGQFLDAEGAQSGGNPHYHLKWLTPDGRVMWLDTDARTGRVLRQSPGRDNFAAPRFGGTRDGPPDRRDEGRGDRRFEGPGDSPAAARRQYRQPDNDGAGRGGFADRFERRQAGGDDRGGFMRPGARNRQSGNRESGNRGFGGGRQRGGHRRR
jgi:hypothetical protein